MMRTITAMFDVRSAADAAVSQLSSQLGLASGQVQVIAGETASTGTATTGSTSGETGFWASLKDLFVPDEDRTAYAEGIRRGNYVVSAQVDESKLDQAMDILEHNGAVDLDAQEEEWRQSGWTGQQASTTTAAVGTSPSNPELGVAATGAVATGAVAAAAPVTSQTSRPAAATAARTGGEEVIPIVEEQVRIGKRDVERGRVRVRSYIVETPVTEQVTLREEHVDVQRRAVDRPLTDADEAFRERVIDATEHSEEAVVGKEARVKEELVIRKDASDRTETVHDTVRRTEVKVDDTTGTTGTVGVTGTTSSNPPGTAASRAVDKTLGTNISGANPDKR
ncbi:YsnF/AvaK domain-containing protein [Muricoccus aerilatus]|uniref:YsnF/AvaK domain-containing protein n=1 Tax=Muricoccus aerilatus TaxID=452982 RepID=UPI0005C1E7AC|nr:YsnF/AvaK domain-containing protein [Roseomonas aerilata]